jgi:MinD-like ATPase involved in chromosome partitioning or flagellar assembly
VVDVTSSRHEDGGPGRPTTDYTLSQPDKIEPPHLQQPDPPVHSPEPQPTSVATEQPSATSEATERPITPNQGWPQLVYWVNCHILKDPDRVPKISAKQRAKIKAEVEAALALQRQADLDEYEALLIEHIRRYNQQRRWCAIVGNVKGGASKSPSAALLANCIGWATRRLTTAIDNNPYEGTLGRWLGIDRDETVTVRQLNERILGGHVAEFIHFSAPLGSNPYNVQMVAADRVAQQQSYDHDIAKNVIVTAKRNSIFTVNDTSNDIGAGAVEAALEESDVFVVPALNKDDKLEGVKATMDNLTRWGHAAAVRHAVVLVNGMGPGQTAEDFREILMLDESTILIGIPFDPWLDKFQAIVPENLQQETRIAALEYVLIVSWVARYTQDLGRDREPRRFKQGRLAKLSSGRLPALSYVKYEEDSTAPQPERGAS